MNKIYKRNYYYKHTTANKILIIFNNFKNSSLVLLYYYIYSVLYITIFIRFNIRFIHSKKLVSQ